MIENKKNTSFIKNIVALTAILLGSQIGAGYASGREIVGFFGDYSWFNVFLVFVLFFGYLLLLSAYGKVAKQVEANNVTDVTKVVFGKFSFVANCLLIISMSAGLSATIAGLDSIATMTLSTYTFPWLTLLICAIVVGVVSGGLKSVLKAGSFVVPFLIITMFTTLIYFLVLGNYGSVTIQSPTLSTMGIGITSALFYVGSNLNASGTLLTQIGNKFTLKSIKWSTFLFALFFSLGVAFTISALYLSTDAIFLSDMPLPALANSINSSLGVVYAVALFMGITMSITAVSFSLTHWLKKYFKNNNFLTVLTIVSLGFLVSRLGFGNIIDYLYPIKGAGGLVVGLGVYFYCIRSKKTNQKK